METLITIVFVVGVLLLILAAVMIFLSVKRLIKIPSAQKYVDNGIHTFEPYKVLPVQVRNTSSYSRDRRMNPTKTVYMVYYRATDGSGYEWSNRVITRELGQKTVQEGVLVSRRVLSIPSDNTYITVEPNQSAENYTVRLRRKCALTLALSVVYILIFLVICLVKLS